MEARAHRWLPLLLVGPVLVLAGIAAAGGGISGEILPPQQEEPRPRASPSGTASPLPPLPRGRDVERLAENEFPGWLIWPLTGLLIALVVAALGVILYTGVHYLFTERVAQRELDDRRARLAEGGLASEPVRQAVAAGLADLDAGGDPRRAVIACWLRLERAAAAAGTARLAADTPGDLVRRLLAGHQVSDRALANLADAYRSARYGPAEVGEELAEVARRALHEIDAELRGRTPDGRVR